MSLFVLPHISLHHLKSNACVEQDLVIEIRKLERMYNCTFWFPIMSTFAYFLFYIHSSLKCSIKYPKSKITKVQVILFEIVCAIFYTNFHGLFCQFISWTKFGNSGKSLDNFWISCQVMADMEKFYDDLIIINLYLHLPDFAPYLPIVVLFPSNRSCPNTVPLLEFRNKSKSPNKVDHFLRNLI